MRLNMTKIDRRVVLDAIVLMIVMMYFIARTWGKWAHPITDFGRELYIPWRLSEGQILYRDIAYLFGAFPPYWNALLFKLFSPSLAMLITIDLVAACLYTVLIYRFLYVTTNRSTAFMGSLGFMMVFVCNFMGYNMYYLTPYSHSNFYAVLFSLAAMNLFVPLSQHFQKRMVFVIGLVLGGVLLSRLEIFLTIIVPVIVGIAMLVDRRGSKAVIARSYAVFLLGLVIPVICAWGYFLQYFPAAQALQNIVGYNPHWQKISGVYLYAKQYLGWERNVSLTAKAIAAGFIFYGAIDLLCRGIRKGLDNKWAYRSAAMILSGLCMYGLIVYLCVTPYVYDSFRGAAIAAAVLAAALFRRLKGVPSLPQSIPCLIPLLVCCFWAVLMLFKVPLMITFRGYGLVYGLPAFLMGVVLFVYFVPQQMQRKYGQGQLSRRLISALLLLICVMIYSSSFKNLSSRNKAVGSGDNIVVYLDKKSIYGLAEDIERFLLWAKDHLGPRDTYVVLPEGVMLNFFTRHAITGPHVSFMPAEMATYGQEELLLSLERDPPDHVLIVHKDNRVYPGMILGRNYAVSIVNWVKRNYRSVWDSRENKKRFVGIEVFQRKGINDQDLY